MLRVGAVPLPMTYRSRSLRSGDQERRGTGLPVQMSQL